MHIAARAKTFAHVFRHGVSGKGDNRRRGPAVFLFKFPYVRRCRIAVHDRHFNIHQNDIVVACFEFFNGQRAVFRYGKAAAGFF